MLLRSFTLAICLLPFLLKAQAYLKDTLLTQTEIQCKDLAWKLVFQDDFDAPLDTSIWITWYPDGPNSSDKCAYCRTHGAEGQIMRDENIIVSDGTLKILVKEEQDSWYGEERAYTAGVVQTKQTIKFKHCKVEARIKIPEGPGFWPAFWMYGWAGNEIDIFEFGTDSPRLLRTNLHDASTGKIMSSKDRHFSLFTNYTKDFHVYGVEWTPYYIHYLVDGKILRTIYRYQKDEKGIDPCSDEFEGGLYQENLLMPDWPLNIIFNVAVGTEETPFTHGPKKRTKFPQQMEVDYVRVYQQIE